MHQTKKVLVIGDNPAFVKLLKDTPEEAGFVVIEAADGDEGLKIALRDHPDLITVDVDIPKQGGFGMLKELRANDWGKDVQVIIMSNLDDMKLVEDVLGHVVYDYVVKNDWPIQKIVDLVKRKLTLC